MGWIGVMYGGNQLITNIHADGFLLLLIGGLSYTGGVAFMLGRGSLIITLYGISL